MNILSTIYMQNKILRGVYRVQQTEAKTTVDTVYIISLLAILCISRDVVSPILSHQPSLCNFTLSNAETILLVNGASRRERVNWVYPNRPLCYNLLRLLSIYHANVCL